MNGGDNTLHEIPSHVFMGGASWACGFYIGVYKALQESYGVEGLSTVGFAGNSAGALIATACAKGMHWKEIEDIYLKMTDEAIRNGVFQKMSIYHNKSIDVILSDSESYKLLNNRLFVGVTQWFDEYKLISSWNSNREVRDCLHASMHVPFYCTHIQPVCIKQADSDTVTRCRAIDGCLSREPHRFNETTLCVAAIGACNDITPRPALHLLDFYRPNFDRYYKMRENGYMATMKWIRHNGTYKNDKYENSLQQRKGIWWKCLVFLAWTLRILEEVKMKRIVYCVLLLFLLKKLGNRYLHKGLMW
eukprot:CAMPEP_0197035330 /NCGR_PEP_ID=MMETSP1384-20130603/13167_1 /TAXON_ID=29189 /ORGANISM="Ammonia sp." /LENGTH=303 /DNA_ID=CAMNT_0042465379 /DNA_START=21 /DNA_END=929 /DNA_ORIENTATION=+